MTFIDDLEKLGPALKSSSLTTKVLVVIATFLQISSITSLSDAVFKWKGFILDGVTFYRDRFVEPVKEIAAGFGLTEYSTLEIDIIVATTTYLVVFIRSLSRIELHEFTTLGRFTLYAVQIYAALMVVLLIWLLGITTPTATLVSYYPVGLALTVLQIFLLGLYIYSRFRHTFFVVFGPVFAAVAIVLVFGAINAGLNRTA